MRPLEMRSLFLECDKDGSGDISLEEFVTNLRGKMSVRRKAMLANIFDDIDEDCDGVISMSDLGASYQPKNHPDVLAGKKKTNDVLNEFFQNMNSVTNTGYVTFDQFVEYYENIAAFDDDSKFEDLIASLWRKHDTTGAYANNPEHHQTLQHVNEESSRNYAMQDTVDKYLPSLQALKTAVKSRGLYGIVNLTRAFRAIDDDMSKSLSLVELKSALKSQYGQAISENQINQLFAHFDSDQTGRIDYEKLLMSLRGEPTASRKKLISVAFSSLDSQGAGHIEPQEMIAKYDCNQHPAVQAGKKTAESVLRELLDNFDVGGEMAGKVTRNEFESYYANLSCSIVDDHFFEQMMRNCWHLRDEDIVDDSQLEAVKALKEGPWKSSDEIFSKYPEMATTSVAAEGDVPSAYLSQVTAAEVEIAVRGAKALNSFPERITRRYSVPTMSPAVEYLLGKLKAELMKRPDPLGFNALERKFKYSKKDISRKFVMSDFKKVAKSMGISLSDHELRSLFESFDYDKQGYIDYMEFMDALCDPLNDRRRQIIGIAFSLLDIDGKGSVEAEKVATRYEAARHPEVIAKRLTPHETERQFLETFDVGGEIEGKVTRAEFENYYRKVGAGIINEDYFELMIRNVWRISTNENGYEKKWYRDKIEKERIESFRHKQDGYHYDQRSQHQHYNIFDRPTSNERESHVMSLSTHAASPPKKLSVQTEFDDSSEAAVLEVENMTPPSIEAPPGILYIIGKLRAELNLRGIYGLIGLQRKFRLLDTHGRRTIDLNEFRQGLHECGIRLQDSESRSLFDHFDNKLCGMIYIEAVVDAVRNPLTPARRAIVNRAFTSIDKRDRGMITVQELLENFDPSKHPDVVSYKRSQQRIYEEFMETFDVGGTVEGCVTRHEFLNYYSIVSSFIKSDREFELIMTSVWKNVAEEGPRAINDDLYSESHNRFDTHHSGRSTARPGILPGTLATKYNVVNQSVKKPPVSEPSLSIRRILSFVKTALSSRGIRGILSLQRLLRAADPEACKILNSSDFKKCMRDARIELTDRELDSLFNYFDTDCVGTIEYEELIKTIGGSLSEHRKSLVNKVFDQLDKDRTDQLDAAFVADSYNAEKHPDVLERKKSAHDVFQDFLYTFDVGGEVEGKVTRNEFENYYTMLGSTINDDRTFEQVLINVWEGAYNPPPTPVPTTSITEKTTPAVSFEDVDKGVSRDVGQADATPKSTSLNDLLSKLKLELVNRGGMGYRALERAFRQIDVDGNRSLDMSEFDTGMRQIGLNLRQGELETLFSHFDVDGSGSIDFEEFMRGVRDELSDHRLDLVEKCFEFLDDEGYGSIDATVLTKKYNANDHPDVEDGKVSAYDAYNDFLNTFDTNAEGQITRSEFVNYYTNLVASVGRKWNNAYFERLLKNTWKVPAQFLSDSTVDVYDEVGRQNQMSRDADKHRPAKTSMRHIKDHSNHSLLYHNNFGEQHGSYHLTLAQSKRHPSQAWNASSLELGAPNLAPITSPTKHLADFTRKAEAARTPVSQRQSGNNTFRSQIFFG